MAKGSQQLAELVGPHLAAGEELLASARFTYNGTVPSNVHTLDSAISVIESVGEPGTPPDPDVAVSFPTANQMAIALTGGRLFLWSLGLSGKPKQFIGNVPLHALARVRAEDGSYGRHLHITMRSSAVVDLEFMRGEPTEEFTDQLLALVDTSD